MRRTHRDRARRSREALVSERAHQRDGVAGHRPLRIRLVIRRRRRLRRLAVATRVRAHDRVALGETARATRCHVVCVRGCPCSSRTASPEPPCRTRSDGLSHVDTLQFESVEHGSILSAPMARKRSWLHEERRRTLGDWVALCLGCGHVQRYFEETESGAARDVPAMRPPAPATAVRRAAHGSRPPSRSSARSAARRLRADEAFGSRIREAGRARPRRDLGEADHGDGVVVA